MTEKSFWSRVLKTDSGCWLWQGWKHKHGYGCITEGRRPNRRKKLAHRKSWELRHGAVPEGMCVLHRCDVRACVNPEHLFLGTQSVNLADMRQKGRQAVGTQYKHSKVTPNIVREIRKRSKNGELQRVIAKDYGVTEACIGRILREETWKHVI